MFEEVVARSFWGNDIFDALTLSEKERASTRAGEAISTYLKLVQGEKITCGNLRISTVNRNKAWLDDKEIPFGPKEYELLEYLMRHQGQELPKRSIMRDVWGPAHIEDVQYLRVFISELRKRLPGYITTVDYVGYMFRAPASAA